MQRFSTFLIAFALFVGIGCNRKKAEETRTATSSASVAAGSGTAPAATPESTRSTSAGQPINIAGKDTGYRKLSTKLVVRESAVQCPSLTPRAEACKVRHGTQGSCRTDKGCSTKPNGFCERAPGELACSCKFGCTKDADCERGEICLCGEPVGQCVPMNCPEAGCYEGTCATYHDGCKYAPFECRKHAPEPTCTF